MKLLANFLFALAILVFVIVVGIAISNYVKAKNAIRQRLKREREEHIRKIADSWQSKGAELSAAISGFNSHLSAECGHCSSHSLREWERKYKHLFDESKDLDYSGLGLLSNVESLIDQFRSLYPAAESKRKRFNAQFVPQEVERFRSFFNNVEGRKLDDQQCKAIVTDEDNNLVIAGAGSGKTTTIVGKVAYVITRYRVLPDEILLISFTNKSASTLAGRINIKGLEAKTFHKFGKDIIAATEQKQPTIFDESQYKRLITDFFYDLLRNASYLNKVTTYFTAFLKPVKSQDEFKNQGAYFQYLKDQNFSTYKTRPISYKGQTTMKREVVKSIEECKIANFLLFNGVEYEYEYPYEHETATQAFRQYKPDFTLNTGVKPVYLEHFAINKQGKVPPFFAKVEEGQTVEQATKEYADGIKWKRELHQSYGTTLIETYSHEMYDGTLFDNLVKKLQDVGIQLRPRSPEEIWSIITEAAKDEVVAFITLFETFITLIKSNNYSIAEVVEKNKLTKDKTHQNRNDLFLEIIAPIYDKYQTYLTARKEIDFSDMINKAAGYILTGKHEKSLRYVIIDEFQDISIGRYQLIKAIKQTNPACKLFCVGDDWQSIYRFTGSDIALFKEFETYFGTTEKSKIETTYRFQTPLLELSSNFILKNPNQTVKALKGVGEQRFSLHQIVYSWSENQDDSEALRKIFDKILFSGGDRSKEIFILGRYSFDIDRIKDQSLFHIDKENGLISYAIQSSAGEIRRLSAKFMTVHNAKGLEADIVIVINCNSGKHGFPSGMSDDPVLNLLLSASDQFENGEERRLFYVAMTRAKDIVYFVADGFYKSKFIAEMEVENKNSDILKCPRCLTADLVLRKKGIAKTGTPYSFFGCSNYLYGCTYTNTFFDR